MADQTNIEWCDSTFNPWMGCTKVSPACDHCYAENLMDNRMHAVQWGAGQPRKRTSLKNWNEPLRWEKEHEQFFAEHGRRRRVFCASLADVFDNEVDPQWRVDLFRLIEQTPNLDWLLLTKRIGNVAKMLPEVRLSILQTRNESIVGSVNLEFPQILPNVWIGATICNQAEADRDIPKLMEVPAAVRFLSIEPLLGAIDLSAHLSNRNSHGKDHQFSDRLGINGRIHWVIVGGESGNDARPMHPDWIYSLRDQCSAYNVPFLFKQWGEWEISSVANGHHDSCMATNKAHWVFPDGHMQKPSSDRAGWQGDDPYGMVKVGKVKAGRLLEGVTHTEFPKVGA